MIQWIKEHPYLSGGLVLAVIVLILVLRRAASSTPVGSVAQASGPSDAVTTAGIAAQAQQSQVDAQASVANNTLATQYAVAQLQAQNVDNQTAAARDVALQNILTQGQTAQYATSGNVQIAQSSDAANVAIANTNASAAVAQTGIQAQVAALTVNDQLAAVENTNATSLGVAQIQGDVTNNQTAAALSLGLAQTKAAVDINGQNVSGAVAINANNNATAQTYIGTLGAVSMAQLDALTQANNNQFILENETLKSVNAGVFNKGGEGGAHQVSVAGAILGYPQIGAPAEAAGAASVSGGNSIGGIIGSIGGAFSGLASGLFGGLFGGGGGSSNVNPITALGPIPQVTSTFTPGLPA